MSALHLRLLLLSICCMTIVHAQTPQLDWVASDGGIGFDIGRAAALDAQGNAYAAGYFQATADFDPGPGLLHLISGGDNDAFVQKLDRHGDLVWARSIGGAAVDEAKGVAVDAQGNVYLAGRFSGTVDFDPGVGVANATAVGMTDAYLLKLDASGNFLWARQMGGAGTDEITALVADGNGVAAVGYFQGTIDLDPGAGLSAFTSRAGTLDFFVVQLDAAGLYQWGAGFGSRGMEFGYGIARGPGGEVYATGCFQDTLDFDPGTGVQNRIVPSGVTAAFILQLNANGSYGWAQAVGTAGTSIGYALRVAPSGSVYVTGGFTGSYDFDPGIGSHVLTSNSYDAWLMKLNAQGSYLGAWSWGGIGDDYGYGMDLTASGGLYIGGGYGGANVDFDPSPGGSALLSSFNTTYDAYIERLDTLGNFGWVRSMGGGGIDYVFGLAADATEHVLTAGCYDQTVDFDTEAGVLNLTTTGNAEVFVHKLKQCVANGATISLSGCDSLQVNGQIYSQSGTYTQTLQNMAGCDSLLTLHVVISHASAATLTDSACVAYSLNGFTYDSSGTYVQLLTNAAGCDSLLTLQLVVEAVDTSLAFYVDHAIANATGATFQWLDCDMNMQAVTGATDSIFYASSFGHFAVEVTVGGCRDTSACYDFLWESVADGLPFHIALSPNPTQGETVLDLGGMQGNVLVSIYDLRGQAVWSGECTDHQKLHFGGASGMYFVIVRTELGMRSLKLWKQ